MLTRGIGQLDRQRITAIAEHIARLHQQGKEVLLVSSGAVGLGMGRLKLDKKPRNLAALQKCAAVGQSQLIETWQQSFQPHGLIVGQVLLTRDNVTSQKRHGTVKALLEEMLQCGIIPVINENDSVSAAELKFGDNDLLSALVATMVEADTLIILSTAPGLIDKRNGNKIIPVVREVTPEIESLAEGTASETATGGMVTKIQAAKTATQSGCSVFICSGENPAILPEIFTGEAVGTHFEPCR